MNRDRADRLMAAALLRRDPNYARLRERDQVERAVDTAMRRQEERRMWLQTYEALVSNLLGDGWQEVRVGECAVCGGAVRPRDLRLVLDELEADASGDVTPRIAGPALVCPHHHISHVTCIPFEIEIAPGEERIAAECAACADPSSEPDAPTDR